MHKCTRSSYQGYAAAKFHTSGRGRRNWVRPMKTRAHVLIISRLTNPSCPVLALRAAWDEKLHSLGYDVSSLVGIQQSKGGMCERQISALGRVFFFSIPIMKQMNKVLSPSAVTEDRRSS